LGFHYKLRVPLDLSYHIREEFYSSEQQETENEAWLRILQDNSRIKDDTRPKWEIVLLHHNGENERTTLIFKISHGLVDAHLARILIDTLTNSGAVYPSAKGGKRSSFIRQVNKENQYQSSANYVLVNKVLKYMSKISLRKLYSCSCSRYKN
jgi:hypothetical protein